ncbi:MAG: group III truncated hemoglobin [Bacteroidetes bacterium]|nr:group III truncated hemoglobin [Bacteroidota bacterium]
MHDILTQTDVAELVDAFYKKVVVDDVIGYLFTDVVALSWDEHIPIMNDFWGSILLNSGAYRRNPMRKHLELDKRERLLPTHFERWLALWQQTIAEHFDGPKADFALARARQIAAVMQHRVEEDRSLDRPEMFRMTE